MRAAVRGRLAYCDWTRPAYEAGSMDRAEHPVAVRVQLPPVRLDQGGERFVGHVRSLVATANASHPAPAAPHPHVSMRKRAAKRVSSAVSRPAAAPIMPLTTTSATQASTARGAKAGTR